jgi:uncharacterized protein YndB with AHSA1/START domain
VAVDLSSSGFSCEANVKLVYTMEICAPIGKVFDLIHDPEKHKLWLQGVEETQYVGEYDPANPVGARFKQKIREGGRVKEYEGVVTAFAKPKHLGICLFAPQFSVQVDYQLTPVESATRLDYSADVSCGHWLIRLLGRVFSFFMRGILRKQMQKLKALAEAGA